MAKQTSIEDQAANPVPGAEGAAEAKATEVNQPAVAVVETPEWVAELIESNKAVIASNESLETLLAEIIESGPDLLESNEAVIASVKAFSPKRDGEVTITKITDNVEFDPELDYYVAAGKEFRAPNDFTTIHSEGDNVNHLGADRLKSLLAQGLVVSLDQEED